MKKNAKNRVGIPQVTDEQVTAMASTGVSDASTDQTVAERSGSDDKVAAVKAENAPPKVKTFTPEARVWIEGNKDLNTEGLFGKEGLAITPEAMRAHAQVAGSLSVDYITSNIFGPDPSAPPVASLVCKTCGMPATSVPILAALIDQKTGELVKDRKTNEPIHRGQFVTNGPDLLNLPVLFAHLGNCLYKAPAHRDAEPTGLRVKRDRNGHAMKEWYDDRKTGQKRWKWALLDAQSFDQATARAAGVRESELAKRATREAEVAENQAEARRQAESLGFKVGDVARHTGGTRTDDGIDRGSFAPKTPRGQTRKQRRWSETDGE